MLQACFYTICLVFCYTLWYFYAFSRTNLLTRCHSASSLFSAVFVFQKSYTGNILRIGQNKSQTSYYLMKLREDRRGVGGEPRAGHTIGRHGPGPGHAPMCETALVHLWCCLFAYKDPINFRETHRDPPLLSTWDREGLEALLGTLPEREIATGGLLHRHACLRHNEWVVYLGLWVPSSS
jgi:hypothetical protein